MSLPRYINGIMTRTIPPGPQSDDFEEELSGRYFTGSFLSKTDGWTFSQGPDVVSYLDSKGSIHPRRFITKLDFNILGGGIVHSNVIIIQDGPRITMTFPEMEFDVNNTSLRISSSSALPKSVVPGANMMKFHFMCFYYSNIPLVMVGEGSIAQILLSEEGILQIVSPGQNITHCMIPSFTITFDNGKF